MAFRWSEGQNKLLIKLVEERPCLWQKNDPEHGDKNIKAASWLQIDTLLGTQGACRRFRSIRDDYTRWTKGTRKGFGYADDMAFLHGQIGHRTINNKNNNISMGSYTQQLMNATATTTIELLDESDVSDGLYDEDDDNQLLEEEPQSKVHNSYSQSSMGYLDDPAPVVHNNGQYVEPPETAKRPRMDTPSSGQDSSTTTPASDWQAPVDHSTLTAEEYQYCKTIISAMSGLPKARKRKLQSRIYNLITEDVNRYEAEVFGN